MSSNIIYFYINTILNKDFEVDYWYLIVILSPNNHPI
jgi:hypothetical protein